LNQDTIAKLSSNLALLAQIVHMRHHARHLIADCTLFDALGK
jgi:hypothetical protein